MPAAQHLDGLSVDETGRASAVVVRGSLYWLTHRDGPPAPSPTPRAYGCGCRRCSARAARSHT
ncbi:hypothetical protein ACFQV4_11140 [Streptomyces thermocarboxydus]